jgi:hypothetical protein
MATRTAFTDRILISPSTVVVAVLAPAGATIVDVLGGYLIPAQVTTM